MHVFWFWPILWHLGSRECCGMLSSLRIPALSVMHFKLLKFYESLLLLLHLVIESCPVFLWCWCPTFVLEAIQIAWKCLVFHFLRFLQTDYFLSYLLHIIVSWFRPILGYLGSRGCCECVLRILFRRVLPVMHLEIQLNLSNPIFKLFSFATFMFWFWTTLDIIATIMILFPRLGLFSESDMLIFPLIQSGSDCNSSSFAITDSW